LGCPKYANIAAVTMLAEWVRFSTKMAERGHDLMDSLRRHKGTPCPMNPQASLSSDCSASFRQVGASTSARHALTMRWREPVPRTLMSALHS
jgi:hypothetical protein